MRTGNRCRSRRSATPRRYFRVSLPLYARIIPSLPLRACGAYNASRRQAIMTKRLRRAFDEVAKLDRAEQDSVARRLLEELASERRWDEQARQ